jgi:uncharacterized protein DUF2785
MDKEFWVAIASNDYAVPEGHTLQELTRTLFGYLGSTDPELRDEIAYIVYANWLKREMFTKEEVCAHVEELLANLDKGIGETESDSVFLRTFSVLLLAEIVHNDNKKPLLDKDVIQIILGKGLWHLGAEKDPRGHIPVTGWAHALAHTADLMLVLGKNRHSEKGDLENILQGIAKKLIHSTNWVYIHGEDDRLANAVLMILQRDLVTTGFLQSWLTSLTEPERSWNGAYVEAGQAKAFHNSRNFLRGLFLNTLAANDLSRKDEVETLIGDALTALVPY